MKKILLFFLLFSFAFMGARAQNPQELDSLEQAIAGSGVPADKARDLNALARQYISVNLDKAEMLAAEAIELAKQHKLYKQLGALYNTAGVIQINIGRPKEAITFTDSSLFVCRQINDEQGLASAYGNMGSYYYMTGLYEKALEYQYKCLKINEKQDDKSHTAITLMNIVGIDFVQEHYEAAMQNAWRAYNLYLELKDIDGQAFTCNTFSIILEKEEKLDSAFYYINRSIELYTGLQNKEGVADGYNQLAVLYQKIKEPDKAISYSSKALDIYEEIGQVYKKMYVYHCMTRAYRMKSNFSQALHYAGLFLALTRELGAPQLERDALEEMITVQAGLGNYKQSYEYMQLFIPLKDSILNENNMSKLSELQTRYKTEKKEQENILLTQKNEIQSLELGRRQYFIYVMIGIVIITSLLSFLFIRQGRIMAHQRTVQLEQRLLRSQMNPHFIFNSLIAIQSYIYKSDPKAAGKYLSSFARLIRGILENSREEYITLAKEMQWLENYLQLQLLRFDNRFEYTINVADGIETETVLIPPMLTQPFIENALEHGFNDIARMGKLSVGFFIKDDFLMIRISDNGTGFEVGQAGRFDNKDHESLAMTITQDRLLLLNRNKNRKIAFDICSRKGDGTVVSFSVPLRFRY